jgi:hypothetical protein
MHHYLIESYASRHPMLFRVDQSDAAQLVSSRGKNIKSARPYGIELDVLQEKLKEIDDDVWEPRFLLRSDVASISDA